MKSETVLRVGDWVEVLRLEDVISTLDRRGQLEGLPFMPEMVFYCGKRFKISAVMAKICVGGRGMSAVAGTPLLLLDELRCEGSSHDDCSRLCTLLWKTAWLKPVDGPTIEPLRDRSENENAWPYPTRTDDGLYQCQATVLPQATVPMSIAGKLSRAIFDVAVREWGPGQFLKMYARAVWYIIQSLYGRLYKGVRHGQPTPIEILDLLPGEWVETKSVRDITATLDRNHKNRGLAFSFYMVPFCGGRYRVKSRVGRFIDDRTGNMKELKHTVILEGVTCSGETTSGVCRRAECLYWREIWLKRSVDSEDRY